MPLPYRVLTATALIFACSVVPLSAQSWVSQPIQQAVPGLWSIGMFDTARGIAVGGAGVPLGISGVIRRVPGNDTWQLVAPGSFTPALPSSYPFWSASTVIRNTGTAWIAGSSAKVYKTTDYGATWTQTVTGITGTATLFDVFFKSLNEGLAVGGNGTAFYTTDGGATWTPQTTGVTTNLYAVHSAGLSWYVSGANNTFLKFTPPSTWTSIPISGTLGSFSFLEGLQFLNDQVGTLSGYNANGTPHVLRTTDGGQNWAGFPTDPPLTSGPSNFYSSVFFFDQNTGWVANLFDPIAYTTDGGQTWSTYTTSGAGSGAISRLDFPTQQRGWASGGAQFGSQGFVLRYDAPQPVPKITTTSMFMDFGTLSCGTFKDTLFAIINSGTAPLRVDSIRFMIPDVALVSPATPFTIQPGQQTVITLRWTPAASFSGPITGAPKMLIYSNDPQNGSWNVQIDGVRNLSGVTASSTALAFGDVCTGAPVERTITLTPEGNLDPTFISIVHRSGDNALTLLSPIPGTRFRNPMPFVFRFTPSTPGPKSGTYEITIGDPACPQTVTISYTGRRIENRVTLAPAVLDFGDVCVGTTKDLTIDITNTGNVDATITGRQFVIGTDLFPNQHTAPFGPIAPGTTQKYTVRFAPGSTDFGLFTAEYKLILAGCPDTVTLSVRGTGIRTDVRTTPTSFLSLGPILAGESVEQQVVFTNHGTTSITATGVRFGMPDPALTIVNAPSFPRVVAPNQTVTVTVRFAPTRIQTIGTSLCLLWSQPCADSSCIAVTATSADPPSIVTRAAFAMPLQRCAAPVLDSLYVRNAGAGPLTLLDFDISGGGAAAFTVLRPLTPATVAPGDSVPVVLRFDTPVEGSTSATLTIFHNDAAKGNRSDVALTGERSVAEFVVEGDTTSLSSVCVFDTASRRLTIRSRGSRAVTVTAIQVGSGAQAWSVSHPSLPMTLQPGTSMDVDVTFRPVAGGALNGRIVITSDPCQFSHVVTLQGDGRTSGLSWTSSAAFGTVDVGGQADAVVRLSNGGTAPATVTHLFVTPSTSAVSLVGVPPLPLTVMPGTSLDVTVRYSPTTVGALLASLCAVASAPCADTVCTSLVGTARSDGLSLDRDRIDLALRGCPDEQACDTVRIVNNSTSTVTVTDIRLSGDGVFQLEDLPTLPLILPSGTSRVIRVCVRPYFADTARGTLTVLSTDATYPSLSLAITAVRDSIGVEVSPPAADAGAVGGCEVPVDLRVTLRNTGTRPLPLATAHEPSAPFALSQRLPAALAPGDRYEIVFRYSPVGAGPHADSLVLRLPCGSMVRIPLSGSVPDAPYTAAPSPLTFGSVGVGSSSTRDLSVRNTAYANARISAVTVTPPGVFALESPVPVSLARGASADLRIRFTPVAAGAVTAQACVIFDTPCPDTLCVTLSGSGSEGGVRWSPAALLFDTLAQCERLERTDTLVNTGASSVTLTSSTVSGPGAAAFTILDPIGAPEPVAAGARRVFTVRFQPGNAADGALAATLSVATTDPTQPSVDAPLDGAKWTATAPAGTRVDFGSVAAGAPATRPLTLTNPGTAPIVITSADLPPGVTVAPPPPVTLMPGASAGFTVTLTTSVTGPYTRTLVLRTGIPCADSTVVQLEADVRPGITLSGVQWDGIPTCAERDTVLRLVNGLPVDVEVESIAFAGPDASYFRVLAPLSFPVRVAPAATLDVLVRFSPDRTPGRGYTAVCTAVTVADGARRPVDAIVTALTVENRLTLRSVADFGPVSLLSPAPVRTLQFRNETPFAITASAVRTTDPRFVIQAVRPALPSVIPPGAVVELDVRFTPDSALTYAAAIEFTMDAPCAETSRDALSGRGVDDAVRVTLVAGTVSAEPDARVLVPVSTEIDLSAAGVASYEGAVRFNRSILHPLRVITDGTKSAGLSISFTYDRDGILRVQAQGAVLGAGAGPLFYIEFLVLIGDDAGTAITIDDAFTFTSGNAVVASRRHGRFDLDGYCLVDGTRLVRSTARFALHGNAPNPFNPTTTVSYELDADGEVVVAVHDATGRIVAVLEHEWKSAGRHVVRFDAAGLPSGVYVATVRHGGRMLARPMQLLR